MVRLGLKAAFLQRGLSQRETSRLTSIPENRLSTIVNGWSDPTADERRKLASVLKQTEQALFDTEASIEIWSAR